MSKQIASIPIASIERVAIVFGGGRSLAQAKGDADYIINGGFYDTVTGKPVCHLKAGGTVYAKENWSCYGMVWDKGGDIRMDVVPDKGGSNYISCVELLTPGRGPTSALLYNAEVGGVRGRSAIALAGDKLLLYCSGDGTADAKTPEALRDELVSLGAQSAIMLDSGGSSQCDFQGKAINSSRRVNNYIAVWLKKTGDDPGKGENNMSKKIVLDPGHGVETAGKRSPDGTYFEHEFNLDMAKRLKPILERHGVEVVLTRSDEHDMDLEKRVEISNTAAPDLFVSLHSNASGGGTDWTSPDGFGIYTSAAGDTAGRNIAAKAILARAKEAGITLWGGGLFHDISLYVLKNTTAPACLIEHGFHTNRVETELLKTDAYRAKLAQVDAKGILDYLGIQWQDEPITGGGEAQATEKASDWAEESWEKAKALGIFDGTNPQGTMTREMTATVLDRLGLLK